MGIDAALEALARNAGTGVADLLGMLMTWWLSPASVINVETPGMTLSDFGEDRDKPLGAVGKWLKTTLMSWIARKTDVGARTYIHAIEPDLSHDAHGAFLMDSQIIR